MSNSRKFLYYDSTVDYTHYEKTGWNPPYKIQYNSFEEFLEIAAQLHRVNNGTHAYFQVNKIYNIFLGNIGIRFGFLQSTTEMFFLDCWKTN